MARAENIDIKVNMIPAYAERMEVAADAEVELRGTDTLARVSIKNPRTNTIYSGIGKASLAPGDIYSLQIGSDLAFLRGFQNALNNAEADIIAQVESYPKDENEGDCDCGCGSCDDLQSEKPEQSVAGKIENYGDGIASLARTLNKTLTLIGRDRVESIERDTEILEVISQLQGVVERLSRAVAEAFGVEAPVDRRTGPSGVRR